ncbi:MAG: hypothetical protein ABSH51_29210 [Solirubrobacteraceae bacterium]
MIHARWKEAVACGTPALLTQAGAMSRPILERLGFVAVGHVHILLDQFANISDDDHEQPWLSPGSSTRSASNFGPAATCGRFAPTTWRSITRP